MSELAVVTIVLSALVAGAAFVLQMRIRELEHRRELTLEFYNSINNLLYNHNKYLRPGVVDFLIFLVNNINNSRIFNKIFKELIIKRKTSLYINDTHHMYYEIKAHEKMTKDEINKTIALFILSSSFYNHYIGKFFRCACNLLSSDEPTKHAPKRLKILLTKEYGFDPMKNKKQEKIATTKKAA